MGGGCLNILSSRSSQDNLKKKIDLDSISDRCSKARGAVVAATPASSVAVAVKATGALVNPLTVQKERV